MCVVLIDYLDILVSIQKGVWAHLYGGFGWIWCWLSTQNERKRERDRWQKEKRKRHDFWRLSFSCMFFGGGGVWWLGGMMDAYLRPMQSRKLRLRAMRGHAWLGKGRPALRRHLTATTHIHNLSKIHIQHVGRVARPQHIQNTTNQLGKKKS